LPWAHGLTGRPPQNRACAGDLSLDVGLGSNRSDRGAGSVDATKLRSNRCRPAAALKSAIASSRRAIRLMSACLSLKGLAGQSARVLRARSTISRRLT